MPDPLKKLKKKELRFLLNNVLHQAVASQYFGEERKYRAHLWDIVNTIDPKVAGLIDGSAEGAEKAYDRTARRAGYYTNDEPVPEKSTKKKRKPLPTVPFDEAAILCYVRRWKHKLTTKDFDRLRSRLKSSEARRIMTKLMKDGR